MKRALLLALLSIAAVAQGPPNQANIPVTSTQFTVPLLSNPDPPYNATIAQVGVQGPQVIYYWISANYLIGKSTLGGPYTMYTATGTLSGSNYVTINPTLSPVATSYDVLKTSTSAQPTGACACAVATNVAVGTVTNDQTNSTSAYTVNPLVPANLTVTLTNEPQSSGISNLILRQNGTFVCNVSTGCGSGGSGIDITTVSGLATVPGKVNGTLAVVTDGTSTTDCSVGGASTNVVCQYNGTSWAPLPSGGGVPMAPAASPLVSQGSSTASVYAAGVTYATGLNWSQSMTTALTAGTPATLTLTPCPYGVDTTSGVGYSVLIYDGSAESVDVTGGTCTSGASSGTITFTPFSSHSSYTVGSASTGFQETLNVACGVSATTYLNRQCNVTLPSDGPGSPGAYNTYNVYGTVYVHASQVMLAGGGAKLNCNPATSYTLRGACLQLGDLSNANDFQNITVTGLSFRTPNSSLDTNSAFAGVNITNIARSNVGLVTITTGTAHGFRNGDMVTILFPDQISLRGDAPNITVTSPTTFTYNDGCTSTCSTDAFASVASPGVVALAHVAILDNANNSDLTGIHNDPDGNFGLFNNFIDLWDDENALIDHLTNSGISLNHSATWSGSFVFMGGNSNNRSVAMAPVVTVNHAGLTANGSNCITDFASNGLYFENSVCQATGLWQLYVSDGDGHFAGAYVKNLYAEATVNPSSPVYTPFAGLGGAGMIAGNISGAGSLVVTGGAATGGGSLVGGFPGGGTGSIPYTYYIVGQTTGTNVYTSPLQILNWNSTGSDTIPISWPRIPGAVSYDIIRMTTASVSIGNTSTAPYPYPGGCPGGSGGTCGSIVVGLTQATACGNTLVCTYTDTGGSTTSAYSLKLANWTAELNFWPGSIVSTNTPVKVDTDAENAVAVALQEIGAGPFQVADYCPNNGQTSPGGYTKCGTGRDNVLRQTATLMSDGPPFPEDTPSFSEGRLIFNLSPFAGDVYPREIITVQPCNSGLTVATTGFRPPGTGCDEWIGTDVPSTGVPQNQGQLAFGSYGPISFYVNATTPGDNVSWLERLTATAKTFTVPLTAAGITDSALTPSASPICANGTGGLFVNVGCTTGSGTVTSVATGTGLTGGPCTTTCTISIPGAGVTNALLANSSITVTAGSGLSGGGTVSLGGTITLSATGSGGTVTSVATGAGLTGGTITGSGTISVPTGGITDTLASLAVKPSVGLVASSNLTLSGAQTIDGVAGTAGTTIVLATAQSTASQNGPWIMQTGSWTRPTWYPTGGTTQAFQFITTFVRLGTVNQGSVWRMTTSGAVTIDTTATTWAITPLNLGATTVAGILLPANGGSGLSNPTANSFLIAEGSGNYNLVTSPSVPGFYQCGFNVISGPVDPGCILGGIQVDATNPVTLLYSDRAAYLNWTSGSALALPAASGQFAANMPFVLQNTSGGTLSVTPTTPNNIDSGTSQAASTLPNNYAELVYQDNQSTINWHTIKFPTLAWFNAPAYSVLANATGATATGGFTANPEVTGITFSGSTTPCGYTGAATDINVTTGCELVFNGGGVYIAGSGILYVNGTFYDSAGSAGGKNAVLQSTSSASLWSTHCSNGASPAVCGANSTGAVALPTGSNPTLTVNTTAVTAVSAIHLTVDESLTISGVTCNTTLSTLLNPVVTARSVGTSFTFTIGAIIATNPACVSYTITN